MNLVLRSLPLTLLFCHSAAQVQHLGPKDAFACARLPAKETREVIAEVERSAYDTPGSWSTELRAKRITLGHTPGLAIQGSKLLCGATGNCQTWIFRKVGDRWMSLFTGDEAPIIEGFRLGPAVSGGIPDLTVWANSSAEASQQVTYKFDGKIYRALK
jgi:hypothetical protein